MSTFLYVMSAVGVLLWVRYGLVPALVKRGVELDEERRRAREAEERGRGEEPPPPAT